MTEERGQCRASGLSVILIIILTAAAARQTKPKSLSPPPPPTPPYSGGTSGEKMVELVKIHDVVLACTQSTSNFEDF